MSKEHERTAVAEEAIRSRLAGRRIVISRPPEDVTALSELLSPLGATVWPLPLIRIEPPTDPEPLATAAAHLEHYDWLVVTSAHAARALARARGGAPWPDSVKVAAVGAGTSRALTRLGLRVTLVPGEARGLSLAAALVARAPGGMAGRRILFPRSSIAGRALPDGLRAAGARVDEVEAYATRPDSEQARTLLAALRDRRVDALVLTSPSNAEALFEAAAPEDMAIPASVRIIAIGPATSARLAHLGCPPDALASDPGARGIFEAIDAVLR